MIWHSAIYLDLKTIPESEATAITLNAQVDADSEAECLAGMDEVWKLYCGMKRWVRKVTPPKSERDHADGSVHWRASVRLYYVNEPGEAMKLQTEGEQILTYMKVKP